MRPVLTRVFRFAAHRLSLRRRHSLAQGSTVFPKIFLPKAPVNEYKGAFCVVFYLLCVFFFNQQSCADPGMIRVVPACLISFPTHSERSHPSAEFPAADSESGGGCATWFNTRTFQKDPVCVLKCHLSSPEQDGARLQGILHFLPELTLQFHLCLACHCHI